MKTYKLIRWSILQVMKHCIGDILSLRINYINQDRIRLSPHTTDFSRSRASGDIELTSHADILFKRKHFLWVGNCCEVLSCLRVSRAGRLDRNWVKGYAFKGLFSLILDSAVEKLSGKEQGNCRHKTFERKSAGSERTANILHLCILKKDIAKLHF